MLIKGQWNSYLDNVLAPTTPGPVQVQETRRAFYAGAQAMLTVLLEILEPGAEATDKDIATMEALDAELRGFGVDVKEGRA